MSECSRCTELEQQVERMNGYLDKMTKELGGKVLRIGTLEADLQERKGQEPESAKVREVLVDWQQVTGHTDCKIDASTERAKKVRARMAQGFTIEQLKECSRRAAQDEWRQGKNDRGKRYDDAATIFKSAESVEGLLGYFDADTKAPPLIPVPAGVSETYARELLKQCDCGHLRGDHARPQPDGGLEPCTHQDCECVSFDTVLTRSTEWIERQAA